MDDTGFPSFLHFLVYVCCFCCLETRAKVYTEQPYVTHSQVMPSEYVSVNKEATKEIIFEPK